MDLREYLFAQLGRKAHALDLHAERAGDGVTPKGRRAFERDLGVPREALTT